MRERIKKNKSKTQRQKLKSSREDHVTLSCARHCCAMYYAQWLILIRVSLSIVISLHLTRISLNTSRRYHDNNYASASILRRQFHFKWGPCELDRYKDMVQGKRERSTAPRGLMLKSNGLKNLRWRVRWRRIYFFSRIN